MNGRFASGRRRRGLGALAGLVLLTACGAARSAEPEGSAAPGVGDSRVTRVLRRIREAHRVPAMAAAIVTSDGLKVIGAVGVRKVGTHIAVSLADQWHLGSDTKAMTATLAGRLVERGRLRWDSTVAEIFPEAADQFHADFRGVTLKQLLAHRAGLPPNLEWQDFSQTNSIREVRLAVVKQALSKAPRHKPGSVTLYSNLGYVIAGAMLERAGGKSWEELLRIEVFEPLGMRAAGFGGLGTPGAIDQPWGHTADGQPVRRNGPNVDNPAVLGPAGRVHCTLQDWTKFIADQLRGARGQAGLLRPETYAVLHAPFDHDETALGWIVTEREWAGGRALNHCGSNTMYFCNAWLAPARDFAVLICLNQGGDTAFKASDAAAGELIRLVQSEPDLLSRGEPERPSGR